MQGEIFSLGNASLRVYSYNTVVAGTGAAGFNAADRLYSFGQKDVAMVTENILSGTSRNTGSDKQTYYKLSLSGNDPDSVRDMAQTLFSGQAVDGDVALCEAALSAQCFLRLVELGVPFPRNRWGEYVGYKTDHDPRQRATSIGPYTSRRMTECLQESVEDKNIPIFDRMQVVRVLGDGQKAAGLLCLDLARQDDPENAFVLFNCFNVIFATGGPAGMYADSAYPHGHYGATGLALEAGARGRNLTEWQYGLASLKPRWNVSGTYMQALPRIFSADASGGDEREFLAEQYADRGQMLSALFLKGYQWPFDARKAASGSSVIDLMVYREASRGRRVFLDYHANPGDAAIDFPALAPEAYYYLQRAGACFGTPIERLEHMNQPAAAFYRDRGVNLEHEPLEIALCAQHNNGGLAVDCWWQTTLEGLFAVGEAAGSHGVFRPGGSALNAGQVGSLRAAQYIAARRQGYPPQTDAFLKGVLEQVSEIIGLARALQEGENNVRAWWDTASRRMSRYGGAIRGHDTINQALLQAKEDLAAFPSRARAGRGGSLSLAFRLRDMLISQAAYLSAMADYLAHGGRSRGSAIYLEEHGALNPGGALADFSFSLDNGDLGGMVQEIGRGKKGDVIQWREVRSIPDGDDFFENVWRDFRKNGNIF